VTDTSFSDAAGRLWIARFTDRTEQGAFDELGVRLADVADMGAADLYDRDALDAIKFGGLIWLSVFDQATRAGVSVDAFADALTPLYLTAALHCLLRAIAVRYPESRLARTLSRGQRFLDQR
jgi:hypothetical protein